MSGPLVAGALFALLASPLAALGGRGWNAGAEVDVSRVRAPYARVRLPVAVDPTDEGDYHDLRVLDQDGVEIPYALDPCCTATPRPSVVARSQQTERPPDENRIQSYLLDAGAPRAAIAAVRIDSATAAFARDVVVERSDDGATWWPVGTAPITRFASGSAQLEVATGGERARWWRVSIRNGDDVPLAGVRVVLLAHPHELVFPVERGRRYALVFGAPHLDRPEYDLDELLRHGAWRAGPAAVGPIVTLTRAPAGSSAPAFAAPGAVGAAAFGTAVVVLAGFALRLLRPESRKPPR